MKRILPSLIFAAGLMAQTTPAPPRALVFFSLNVEADHVLFATSALQFLAEVADRNNFRVEATSNWADMNDENLKQYKLVMWLNGAPGGQQQQVFQRYMENGGGWLGFHVAAYNDRNSRWTWFKQFIGGGAFGVNNWPPLPAKVITDDLDHPVTKGLPKTWTSPTNEWYSWRPSPRLDKNIKVLLSLDPAQYPLGIKGIITADKDADVPVMWTNTNFRMLYMNMGHGDKVFAEPMQNRMIEKAILWVLNR